MKAKGGEVLGVLTILRHINTISHCFLDVVHICQTCILLYLMKTKGCEVLGVLSDLRHLHVCIPALCYQISILVDYPYQP